MVTAPSRAIALFGTGETVPAKKRLRAGPVTLDLDGNMFRHVRVNGDDAVRMIAFVIEVKGLETPQPMVENLKVGQGPTGFDVSFDAVFRQAGLKLCYSVKAKGLSDGTLTFDAVGKAITDVTACKVGFVVQCPSLCLAGRHVEIERLDGSTTTEVFPKFISSNPPVQDLRAFGYEVRRGVDIHCHRADGNFDVEDLRNDGQSCFSARPSEVMSLKASEVFERSITLGFSAPTVATARSGPEPVLLTVGDDVGTMPAIGLALAPEQDRANLQAIDLLKELAPQFLICPFDSRIADGAPKGLLGARISTFPLDDPRLDGRGEIMGMFKAIGDATGADLVLEAMLACQDQRGAWSADVEVMRRDLATIRQAADEAEIRFDRVAVSHASSLVHTTREEDRLPAPHSVAIYEAARRVFDGLPIGGGTFSYFADLNSKRPSIDAIDFISHTTCPTVHASDDISVMESLEALPDMVTTVRNFAGDLPYYIGPSTIGARINPFGEAVTANPHNRRLRLARLDPRQRGLFGAAWNLGYVATLAQAGIEAVALSGPVGEFGVIAAPMDYEQPWFDQQGLGVYPVYHVLRGLADGAGKVMLRTTLTDRSVMQAIAWRDGGQTTLWVANLTSEPQEFRIEGLPPSPGKVATLDLDSFVAVTRSPHGLETREEPLDLFDLGAYGVMRIDVAV
ncbi:MAG: hypothetical protein AAFO01_01545 [Pseudomonadota bacterium]